MRTSAVVNPYSGNLKTGIMICSRGQVSLEIVFAHAMLQIQRIVELWCTLLNLIDQCSLTVCASKLAGLVQLKLLARSRQGRLLQILCDPDRIVVDCSVEEL